MDSMANLMTNNNAIVKLLQTYTEKNQYEEYNYMCKTEDTINETIVIIIHFLQIQ